MELYLIQHALSKSKEEDPQRGLTVKGGEDVKKIARFFSQLNPKIDLIMHSGKKRAEQTARIISDNLGLNNVLKEESNLAPNDDVNILFNQLKTDQKNLIIVGHLPYLTKLSSVLLGNDEDKKIVNFHNAGIVKFINKGDSWILDWIVVPEILG